MVALPAAALRLLAPVWACGFRLCVWARSPPPCRVSARPYIYSPLWCGCVSLLASPPPPLPWRLRQAAGALTRRLRFRGRGLGICGTDCDRQTQYMVTKKIGVTSFLSPQHTCLVYALRHSLSLSVRFIAPLRNMPLHDITPSRVNKRSAPLTWRDVTCATYYERSVHNETNQ